MADPAPDTDDDVSRILGEQVEKLLEQHVTKPLLLAAEGGAWAGDLWSAVEEMGLTGALVPEAAGGFGLSATQAMALVRRAAYHSAPIPLGETIVAKALWVMAGGDPVEGAISLAPTRAQDRLSIARSGEGWTISGRAERVPWGGDTDHLLLWALDGNGAAHVALTPPSVCAAVGGMNLAYEPRPTLVFDSVPVSTDRVRAAPFLPGDGLLSFGALIRAQQMAGAMERCLDTAIAYANERVQFGRALGRYQAIQHLLAEAAGHFAAGSAAADGAVAAWGKPSFAQAVAIAKARAGEAAGKVAAICHQVHGAMGFTQEYPLHFATRRLLSWRDEFGGDAYWQEELGRAICRAGADGLWDLLQGIVYAQDREQPR